MNTHLKIWITPKIILYHTQFILAMSRNCIGRNISLIRISKNPKKILLTNKVFCINEHYWQWNTHKGIEITICKTQLKSIKVDNITGWILHHYTRQHLESWSILLKNQKMHDKPKKVEIKDQLYNNWSKHHSPYFLDLRPSWKPNSSLHNPTKIKSVKGRPKPKHLPTSKQFASYSLWLHQRPWKIPWAGIVSSHPWNRDQTKP